MIIKIKGKWVNPDHVTHLEPHGGGVLLHLVTGKHLNVGSGADGELSEVALAINEATSG